MMTEPVRARQYRGSATGACPPAGVDCGVDRREEVGGIPGGRSLVALELRPDRILEPDEDQVDAGGRMLSRNVRALAQIEPRAWPLA
jgi:hypothetical protein